MSQKIEQKQEIQQQQLVSQQKIFLKKIKSFWWIWFLIGIVVSSIIIAGYFLFLK